MRIMISALAVLMLSTATAAVGTVGFQRVTVPDSADKPRHSEVRDDDVAARVHVDPVGRAARLADRAQAAVRQDLGARAGGIGGQHATVATDDDILGAREPDSQLAEIGHGNRGQGHRGGILRRHGRRPRLVGEGPVVVYGDLTCGRSASNVRSKAGRRAPPSPDDRSST